VTASRSDRRELDAEQTASAHPALQSAGIALDIVMR
jgi:hypothetical protein